MVIRCGGTQGVHYSLEFHWYLSTHQFKQYLLQDPHILFGFNWNFGGIWTGTDRLTSKLRYSFKVVTWHVNQSRDNVSCLDRCWAGYLDRLYNVLHNEVTFLPLLQLNRLIGWKTRFAVAYLVCGKLLRSLVRFREFVSTTAASVLQLKNVCKEISLEYSIKLVLIKTFNRIIVKASKGP